MKLGSMMRIFPRSRGALLAFAFLSGKETPAMES